MTAGPRGLSDAATVSIATIKSASQPVVGSTLGNADHLAEPAEGLDGVAILPVTCIASLTVALIWTGSTRPEFARPLEYL